MESNKERYYFYFDESNRNGNIKFKNGIPNFWCKSGDSQRKVVYYVGCYLGWSKGDHENALAKYQELEKWAKSLLSPGAKSELYELKSQKIRADYTYGLKTFSEKHIKFYTRLFQYLQETHAIYQLNIINPIEILIRDGLDFEFSDHYSEACITAFKYTITKFLQNYGDEEVWLCMEDFLATGNTTEFKTAMESKLHHVIEWGRGVERKEGEVMAFTGVLQMLGKCVVSRKNYPVKFNYMIDACGLYATLSEQGIPSDDVIIQIDKEETTKVAIEEKFANVTEVDSKTCVGVRACDIVAGFIYNMLKAIAVALAQNEFSLSDKKASPEIRILSKDWFDISKEQFDLYKEIGNYLASEDTAYFTVTTGKCADEVSLFYSFLHYFKKFDTYENYLKRNMPKHVKEFHAYSIQRLHKEFCRM